jgi:GTP-binding protein EngB required for normal cell division
LFKERILNTVLFVDSKQKDAMIEVLDAYLEKRQKLRDHVVLSDNATG